eukprot:6501566-Heterocapsa_arctica.AAC.1
MDFDRRRPHLDGRLSRQPHRLHCPAPVVPAQHHAHGSSLSGCPPVASVDLCQLAGPCTSEIDPSVWRLAS